VFAGDSGIEGQTCDGELIDIAVVRANRAQRDALFRLRELLARLNARPGAGINFSLIVEVVRAERAVRHARETLSSVGAQTPTPPLQDQLGSG